MRATQEPDLPLAIYRGNRATTADETFVTDRITVNNAMVVDGTNVVDLLKEMERDLSDAKHHLGSLKAEIDKLAKYKPGFGSEFKAAFARFASNTASPSISFRFLILFAVLLCELVCISFLK